MPFLDTAIQEIEKPRRKSIMIDHISGERTLIGVEIPKRESRQEVERPMIHEDMEVPTITSEPSSDMQDEVVNLLKNDNTIDVIEPETLIVSKKEKVILSKFKAQPELNSMWVRSTTKRFVEQKAFTDNFYEPIKLSTNYQGSVMVQSRAVRFVEAKPTHVDQDFFVQTRKEEVPPDWVSNITSKLGRRIQHGISKPSIKLVFPKSQLASAPQINKDIKPIKSSGTRKDQVGSSKYVFRKPTAVTN